MKAFIFDVDGVITDTAEHHYQAWKQLADEMGISFGRNFNEQLKGIGRVDSLERILLQAGIRDTYSESEKEILITRKNEDYKKRIASLSEKDILPGIESFIQQLQACGYKMGVASASRNSMAVLKALKLADEFDVIADAAKVSRSKPAPDIFLLAAEGLGIEPEACVGIEDAASGIEAIRRAGMFAVGIGNRGNLGSADLILSSTDQLHLEKIVAAWERWHK